MEVISKTRLLRAIAPPTMRLGAAFTQFFATLVIARALGVVDSSAFFFWSSLMMSFSVMATFGLDKLALQRTPRLLESPSRVGELLGQISTIVMVIALIFGGLLALYGVHLKSIGETDLQWVFLLPFGVLGIALCRVNGEALKGMEHPNLAIVYRQLLAGSFFLVLLLLLWNQLSSQWAVLVYVISFLSAAGLAYIGPGMREYKFRFSIPSWATTATLLRSGLPIWVHAVLSSVAFAIPLMVLQRSAPPEAVSYFTTSYRVFMLISLLSLAAYSIDLPALSRAGNTADKKSILAIYLRMIATGCAIFFIPIALLAYFSDYTMMLFGNEFKAAGVVLLTFMLFSAASLLLGPTDDLLLMINRKRQLAYTAVMRAVCAASLSFWLIPKFGAVGAALVISISILAHQILGLYFYYRYSKLVENTAA